VKIRLGPVGHFGLAVRTLGDSARWWQSLFDLTVMFEGDRYVGLTNDSVTIVLFEGKPHPETIQHLSFHVAGMKALREALNVLKEHHVDVEDPGDEIGPEAEGSSNMGLWFKDLDGYRWELSVQGGRDQEQAAARHRLVQ